MLLKVIDQNTQKSSIFSSQANLAKNLFILLALTFCSCSESGPSKRDLPMQIIKGRDHQGTRLDVYRVRVPASWIRKDTLPEESLIDTTKSICEFMISKGTSFIRITIHNFPSDTMDQRIPPAAQIARWERQFDLLISSESSTIPQAFNGFVGLKFKGVGTLNQKEVIVLGWSVQLSKEHYRTLTYPKTPLESTLFSQMRADVTIKAVGPKELMEDKEIEIHEFARSFELIAEIPSRS